VNRLEKQGSCIRVEGKWQWSDEAYPADTVGLRSITSDNFGSQSSKEGDGHSLVCRTPVDRV
jgi:hypothetical protein